MPLSIAIGKPPSNTLIDSEPGWSRVPGYDDSMPVTLRALGIGLVLATLLAIAWRLLVQDGLPFQGSPAKSSMVLVLLIATIGHELCHLLLFPRFGFQNSTIGVWPQMGAFFVQHMRPVSRSRFLLATESPTILICLLPLMLGICGVTVPPYMHWASVLNGVAVGADLLAVLQLLRHATATALVLDSNHALFQREP